MNFIAGVARDVCTPPISHLLVAAKAYGWRATAESARVDGHAAVRLYLGHGAILAHHVAVGVAGAQRRLELLRRLVLQSSVLEHYIVMEGFDNESVRAYAAKFAKVGSRRITVGTWEGYRTWLPARLGPLAHLDAQSPVRRLMEDLLRLTVAPEPAEKDPLTCTYKPSSIKPDFDYGQMGVQCLATLFTHVKGPGAVRNLEGDADAQKKGTDLDVASSFAGDCDVAVELKTERYASGRITLELHSCYEAKENYPFMARTPGWLDTCKAEVLISTIWPTGDALVVDFNQLLQWLSANPRHLVPEAGGTRAKQGYISWILLARMTDILRDIPGAVHLRLGDWLPSLYPGEFKRPGLVSPTLGRTLAPQRLS